MNTYKTQDGSKHVFQTKDGTQIVVAFDQNEDNYGRSIMDITFGLRDQTDGYSVRATGANDPFAILAKVIELSKAEAAKRRPDLIRFTADLSEPSRVKLYDRLVATLARQMGLAHHSRDNASERTYWIVLG